MTATASILSGNPSLRVDENRGVTSEFVSFIENVVWGTDGARYRLEEYGPTLQHLPAPMFLTLRRQERLVALRLLLEKKLQLRSESVPAFYHSFFSVLPSEKNRGYGRRLADATVETFLPRLKEKGVIYSHVEVENERSARIHEALGYEMMGRFSVMSFCRLFPKPNPHIKKLAAHQVPSALAALRAQYVGHAWNDCSRSMDSDNFYVLMDGETLVAGAQVLRQRWTILNLGGFGGAVALKALPYIPVIRDVFNPADFRFLKFGNTFFAPGHEADVFTLWEGLLAMHGLKTGMFFMDPLSPATQRIRSIGSLGFLNSLTETPVNIFAMFRGFSADEIRELRSQPKYISPNDL